nr:acyltransferase [Terriglobales bacterium]
GLRGVCISLVLLAHLSGTRHFFHSSTFELYGNLGVRTFFVLSGYLITAILVKEHGKTGSISVLRFYARRAWRILPPAYLFMLVAICWQWKVLSWANILTALTFTSNYHFGGRYVLGHLWSLAAEEQFYLLWPLVLLFHFHRRGSVVTGVMLAGPPLRILLWLIWGRHGMGHPFPVLMDALAAGCALQILQPKLARFRNIFASRWSLAVVIATFLLPLTQLVDTRLYQAAGLSLLHLGIAYSIQHLMANRYWLLDLSPVAWLGKISFSLYLWQQLFLNRWTVEPWTAFPLNLILALACGALSFYLVEQPSLKLRDRLAGCERRGPMFILDLAPVPEKQVSRAG